MKAVLQGILADPKLEASWLNTVSLMELIGARKIAKTVCRSHPSVEILEHFADESRHALAFKKLAEAIEPKIKSYLCREEAVTYFQSLDHGLKQQIIALTGQEDEFLNYLMTTTVIERRAMKLYPLYRELSTNPVVRDELERVIGEESNHRVPLENMTRERLSQFGPDAWDAMLAFEDQLFARFEQALFLHLKKAA